MTDPSNAYVLQELSDSLRASRTEPTIQYAMGVVDPNETAEVAPPQQAEPAESEPDGRSEPTAPSTRTAEETPGKPTRRLRKVSTTDPE